MIVPSDKPAADGAKRAKVGIENITRPCLDRARE
jgi:hypothetical protein